MGSIGDSTGLANCCFIREAVWRTSWPAGLHLFFSKKNMAINIYGIHRPSVFGAGPLRYLGPSVSFIYKATFEAFNPQAASLILSLSVFFFKWISKYIFMYLD